MVGGGADDNDGGEGDGSRGGADAGGGGGADSRDALGDGADVRGVTVGGVCVVMRAGRVEVLVLATGVLMVAMRTVTGMVTPVFRGEGDGVGGVHGGAGEVGSGDPEDPQVDALPRSHPTLWVTNSSVSPLWSASFRLPCGRSAGLSF